MYPHAPCRRLVHPEVEHDAVPNAATRGGAARLHAIFRMPRSLFSPGAFLAGLCSSDIPFGFGQAEDAVANLPLRLAVRVRCGHPSLTGFQWAHWRG
jgi:hypothetical protein